MTLTFKSYWDIEWDYDYGFVLAATPTRTARHVHVARVGEGLHDAGRAQPERERAASCSTATASPARAARTRRARRTVDRLPAVGSYPRGRLPRRRVRPDGVRGHGHDRDPLLVLDRPGPRPAGLVHRRREGHDRRRHRALLVRFRERRDEPAIYNGGCNEAASSTADRCTAGWRYLDASPTVRGRPRVLPRDARPLGLRRDRHAARTTATRSASSRACSSTYTNEADGLRQHRPGRAATRRTSRRSTRVPQRGQRPRRT